VKTEARYEFRIWSHTLDEVRGRLLQLATPGGPEVSEEIYLVSATNDKCNAKIRNETMDIKRLISVEDGLECWIPVLKVGFPLKTSVIADDIFPNLNVQTPELSKAQYGKVELLDEVMDSQPKIAIVPVAKTRLRFTMKTCRSEFASTAIRGVTQDTVAVEDCNPRIVWQLIHEIGINGGDNVSYIRHIKRILGW